MQRERAVAAIVPNIPNPNSVMQKLTMLTEEYNKLGENYNYMISVYEGNREFILTIIGILYTNITGQMPAKEQPKPLSDLLVTDMEKAGLNYLRNSMILYLNTLEKDGNVQEAMEAFIKFFGGIDNGKLIR